MRFVQVLIVEGVHCLIRNLIDVRGLWLIEKFLKIKSCIIEILLWGHDFWRDCNLSIFIFDCQDRSCQLNCLVRLLLHASRIKVYHLTILLRLSYILLGLRHQSFDFLLHLKNLLNIIHHFAGGLDKFVQLLLIIGQMRVLILIIHIWNLDLFLFFFGTLFALFKRTNKVMI